MLTVTLENYSNLVELTELLFCHCNGKSLVNLTLWIVFVVTEVSPAGD